MENGKEECKTYTAVIWGAGKEFLACFSSVQRQEEKGNLKILAISPAEVFYKNIYGYPAVSHQEIKALNPDLVISAVPPQSQSSVYHMAQTLGLSRKKFVRGDVFTLPDFDLQDYMALRDKPVSVVADNCFAGLLYHHLDLPFASPTINMWISSTDFVMLSTGLRDYMNEEIVLDSWRWQTDAKHDYPIMRIGDVRMHCNHTASAGAAKEDWEKRKQRICYDNLLFIMRAATKEQLEEFSLIPGRKLCFTSLETKMPKTCFLPAQKANMELWRVQNGGVPGFFSCLTRSAC